MPTLSALTADQWARVRAWCRAYRVDELLALPDLANRLYAIALDRRRVADLAYLTNARHRLTTGAIFTALRACIDGHTISAPQLAAAIEANQRQTPPPC